MDITFPEFLLPGFLIYAVIITMLLKPGKTLSKRLATVLIAILFGVSVATELITWHAALLLITSALFTTQITARNSALKTLAWLVLSAVPLALALHLIPGFTSTTLFGPTVIGLSSIPYTLNANIDKAMGALLIIFPFRYILRTNFNVRYEHSVLLRITAALVAFFALANLLGVPFDPKFGQLSFAFIFLNLFVTCVAEEAFFRLLIQRFIHLRTQSASIAIIASALIFTLAHFHTGPGAIERMSLIFLAGILYAWSFHKTNSLLVAILCHFAVNFIHFTFFAYPATFY